MPHIISWSGLSWAVFVVWCARPKRKTALPWARLFAVVAVVSVVLMRWERPTFAILTSIVRTVKLTVSPLNWSGRNYLSWTTKRCKKWRVFSIWGQRWERGPCTKRRKSDFYGFIFLSVNYTVAFRRADWKGVVNSFYSERSQQSWRSATVTTVRYA